MFSSSQKITPSTSNRCWDRKQMSDESAPLIPFPDPRDMNYDSALKAFKRSCPDGSDLAGVAVIKTHANNFVWSVNYVKKQSLIPHMNTKFPDPALFDIKCARAVFQSEAPRGSVVSKVTATHIHGLPPRWNVTYKISTRRSVLCAAIRRTVSNIVSRTMDCVKVKTHGPKKDVLNDRNRVVEIGTEMHEISDGELMFEVYDMATPNRRILLSYGDLDPEKHRPRKIFYKHEDVTFRILGKTRFSWGDISRMRSGHIKDLKLSNAKKGMYNTLSNYVKKCVSDKHSYSEIPVCEEPGGINIINVASGRLRTAGDLMKVRTYLAQSRLSPSLEAVSNWVIDRKFTVDVNLHGESVETFIFKLFSSAARQMHTSEGSNFTPYEYAVEISNMGLQCTPHLWIAYVETVTKNMTKISEVVEVMTNFSIRQ